MHVVKGATAKCYAHSCTGPVKLVTLIDSSSKWHRLLFAGDDDEVFMTRRFNVTPKTTEQNLIVHTGKSEAKVTNNERLHSRYCSVKANY